MFLRLKIYLNEIVEDIHEKLEMPHWAGKQSKYILKVKARHLEEEQKTKGVATITLKNYDYEQFTGYVVTMVAFNCLK